MTSPRSPAPQMVKMRSSLRCCLCWSPRTGALVSGVYCLARSLAILLPLVYSLVNKEVWRDVRTTVDTWLESPVLGFQITVAVGKAWQWVSSVPENRYKMFLAGFISATVLHLLCGLLLILGAMIEQRSLLIPWLFTDMLLNIIFILVFIVITLLSFLVDLLVALIFPVMAGLEIGLWFYSWRNVVDLYQEYNISKAVIRQEIQGTVYSLVPAKHTK